MVVPGEQGLNNGIAKYFPATQALLRLLDAYPDRLFECSHGEGSLAVGIYEVPEGCVALKGVETQMLCAQHIWSDGSLRGMNPIVDLTINAGLTWRDGGNPDYFIAEDPLTGEVVLKEFGGEPTSPLLENARN